jgi:hypothetical protein
MMRRSLVLALFSLLCLTPLFAQQTEINRYDGFTGFSYLGTPSLNLNEYGFDGSFGVNVKRWAALGFDLSTFSGSGSAKINQTTTSTQNVFAGQVNSLGAAIGSLPLSQQAALAPLIPACATPTAYLTCSVPFNVSTFTFAAGPQFNIRHWKPITPFFRPALGLYHQSATLKVSQSTFGPLLAALHQPEAIGTISNSQSNNVLFVGLGGGVDLNVSKHVGIRTSFDWVNTHSFSSLLKDRQNNYRLSVGPQWKFGELHESK